MLPDDIRGTFMGYHIVLVSLVQTHRDLAAFKSALDANSVAMLRSAAASPDAMLHPAEKVVEMFDNLVLQTLRDRGED